MQAAESSRGLLEFHRSLQRGSIWGGRGERGETEEVTRNADSTGGGTDGVGSERRDEDGEEVEMFVGGGEASVLSVQRRTNPKHAADYSRGMKMHNCEGAACSRRRT